MRSSAVFFLLVTLAGCSSKPARPIARQLVENAKYTPQQLVSMEPVQLSGGRWDGPSDTGFSHPYVSMMPDFTVYGDIDGDGNNEAVVIVLESGGGSAVIRVLGLFARPGEEVRHVSSIPLGDRVQIRTVQIRPRELIAEYVRMGENEPLCCPTEIARTTWNYLDGKFSLAADQVLGKLGPAFLAGTTWELQPPGKPPITLTSSNGNLSGETGCGHYDIPAKSGEFGGAIVVQRASTLPKKCTGPDQEYLARIQHATRMGFLPDRLWISYDLGGDKESGTLEFKEAAKPTSSQP